MDARVPVTLLGGYLGSGKTTRLNELLENADRRYAVLINDVGAINIDAALVAERSADTIELSDGCVCCSLVDGFATAFERLRERPEPPDHVLVELSGVAEPLRAAPFASTTGFRLDGIVVLFDADQGLDRERDRFVGDSVRRQLQAADLLLLTHCDRVGAERLAAARTRLAELSPGVPVLEAPPGRTPPEVWAPPQSVSRPAALSASADAMPEVHRVVSLEAPSEMDAEALAAWLESLPDAVVRVKGLVRTGAQWCVIQAVGRRRSVALLPSGAPEPAAAGIVVIGTPALDGAGLRSRWQRARA